MKLCPLSVLLLLPSLACGGEHFQMNNRWSLPTVEQAASMTSAQVASASNLAGATASSAPVAGAQNVYVEMRPDHAVGAGTQANPYDGSTQARFDAVIAKVNTMNINTPIVLHIGTGTYTMTPVRQFATAANPGGYVWNTPGNLTIEGAGENSTTVRAGIVGTANSTYYVFFGIGPYGPLNFENLTIDCNTQNQTIGNVTIDGVSGNNFGGSLNSFARNVHVINGGNAPGQKGVTEWFGIVEHDYRVNANAVISNCLVDTYRGNAGCTTISATTAITDNVVVLNNNDPYNFALTPGGGGGGYQNAYSCAHLVQGNVCRNCTFGIYSDVGSVTDFTVENNWFTCLYEGICMFNGSPTSTITDITIEKNVILRTYMQAITLGTGATKAVNTNLDIIDNVLDTNDIPGAGRGTDIVFSLVAAANCDIQGNTISTSQHGNYAAPTAGTFTNCNLSTFTWANNEYSPAGGLLAPPAGVPAQ